MIATIGALALAGVASDAYAQTRVKPAPVPAFTIDQNAWASPAGDKTLQWNGKGRWGLKLDYDQPTQRDAQPKDFDAGVAFKVTRRLQVSGSVNLDTGSPVPSHVSPDEKPQPRVRLETTFRF